MQKMSIMGGFVVIEETITFIWRIILGN